jgi:hypothetical protein
MFLAKRSELSIEYFGMSLGLGLCIWILLVYVFDILGIPLNIYYVLAISLLIPAFHAFRLLTKGGLKSGKMKYFDFSVRKKHIVLLVLAFIFIVTLYMYMKGSFRYPYLEDSDPYLHADAATYIQERQTFRHVPEMEFSYLLPYPPAYSSLMGMISQTNTDVVWTLKFFNALILSLSVLWFFWFSRVFFKSGSLALFSTFVLAAIPAYLSHFIFAHSLGVSLFGVGMYFIVKSVEDSRWGLPTALSIAALLVVQATVAVVFGIFSIIFFVAYCIKERKFLWKQCLWMAAGLCVALVVFWVPNIVAQGGFSNIVTAGKGENLWSIGLAESSNQYLFTLSDFFITRMIGGIDTQVGIGVFACFLAIFGVLYFFMSLFAKGSRKEMFGDSIWIFISFCLLALTLLGVNGGRLPVRLVPLRWWAFFAIAFALFSATSLSMMLGLFRRTVFKYFLVALIVVGIVFTSFISRYAVQTSVWPPHLWTNLYELRGYLQLKETEYDGIFPICSDEFKIHFMNKRSYLLGEPSGDADYFMFKERAFNQSAEGIHSFLYRHKLGYVLFDMGCVLKFGLNETDGKISEMIASGYFEGVFQNQGVILLESRGFDATI